jgi:hypothetical protein
MTYSEKLKDPRWQKKRLAILERAGWKCQCCGDDKQSLQIHHLIYLKGEPWDAPDENLECLCRDCHEWREEFNKFAGGRTLIPTILCYTFIRFSGTTYKKIPNRPADWTALKEFAVYLSFFDPSQKSGYKAADLIKTPPRTPLPPPRTTQDVTRC